MLVDIIDQTWATYQELNTSLNAHSAPIEMVFSNLFSSDETEASKWLDKGHLSK